MNMGIENNMLHLLCQTILVRSVQLFINFFSPLDKFKDQSAQCSRSCCWCRASHKNFLGKNFGKSDLDLGKFD